MQLKYFIKQQSFNALVSAILATALLLGTFLMLEPTVTRAQLTESTFTTSVEIGGEVSFVAAVDNATMTPSIQGLSGGTANGSTTFQVNSNDPAGYTVTIQFDNATTAMRLGTGTDPAKVIPNYGGTEQLVFSDGVGANEARFGFTVGGTNAAQLFRNNGASCNQSAGTATGTACWWLGDTSITPATIVDSDAVAASEEHTLYFRVQVNENPSPTLELGTYTATATLTLAGKT